MNEQKGEHTVLFVDDEENVLKALERLFEDEGYHILTAKSGEEGIEKVKKEKIAVIVSDSRMPGMDGVAFFQNVSGIAPDTVRIMMTGFTDMEAVISAINKGEVYRYITKPWKDDELKLAIKDCIKHFELIEQNRYLTDLTLKQNEELKDLNKNLEEKVEERTREIKEKNEKLKSLYEALDKSFVETVRIILKVLDIKDEKLGAHAKRVTALAVSIAKDRELESDEVRDIEIAALLHDIGKVNMPSFILFKKDSLLTYDQRIILKQHPVIGNLSLSAIERLKKAAEIVLHHHENVDGSGYPYLKKGDEIPLGAKIVSVADAFDKLTSGTVLGTRSVPGEEALREIKEKAGTHFDADVVSSLEKVLKNVKNKNKKKAKKMIPVEDLREGMVLASNVCTQSGILLMRENDVLNTNMISRIKQYMLIEPLKEAIMIYEEK